MQVPYRYWRQRSASRYSPPFSPRKRNDCAPSTLSGLQALAQKAAETTNYNFDIGGARRCNAIAASGKTTISQTCNLQRLPLLLRRKLRQAATLEATIDHVRATDDWLNLLVSGQPPMGTRSGKTSRATAGATLSTPTDAQLFVCAEDVGCNSIRTMDQLPVFTRRQWFYCRLVTCSTTRA